jgi:hypothetical protein
MNLLVCHNIHVLCINPMAKLIISHLTFSGGQNCVEFQLLNDPNTELLKTDLAELRVELRSKSVKSKTLVVWLNNLTMEIVWVSLGFQVETIERLEQVKSEFQDIKRLMLQILGSSGNQQQPTSTDVPALPLKCPSDLEHMERWLESETNVNSLVCAITFTV